MLDSLKYNRKKTKQSHKNYKKIYMKFALKIGSFFGKVIIGYKNENSRSNRGLKNKKKIKKDDSSKNISRHFSGAVVGSVGSVQFQIVP